MSDGVRPQDASMASQYDYFMGLVSGAAFALGHHLWGVCDGPTFYIADQATMTRSASIARANLASWEDINVAFRGAMDARPFWQPWSGTNDLPDGATIVYG